jgi:Protein of unknown function (DUF3102)
MMLPARSTFTYDGLPAVTAAALRAEAGRIRKLLKATVPTIIEVGRALIEVKAQLDHGKFGDWVDSECGFSLSSAENYMRVAERFGDKIATVANLSPTTVYRLAAKSTPPSIVEAALQCAARGDVISDICVETAVDKAKIERRQAAKKKKATKRRKSEQDFGFNAFAGLEPKNTAEVLLATQMVACHEVGMALITRSKLADNVVMMQEAGNLAAKLLGLYERQFVALTKARKPPQVVIVEHVHKHLHVNGQPIPGATGVINKIEGQPYETKPTEPRASAIAPGPEMLGDTPTDPDALPVASDAERSLPNPRRLVARGAKR